MAKSYICIGSENLGLAGSALANKALYSKKEKIWLADLTKLYPDIHFEKLFLADLLKVNEAEHIFVYPQLKAFIPEIRSAFPEADLRYIDSL
ncbi:hypothetical protein ACFO26_00800 [Lactococcus nasutitermitis]|uniref:Uncharacterized protein n=1 Tax=Lactococcus nasutitermitis TaxID=1652957 RepID=A0ABV9J9I3_9LACT|nr:hypothetical protein [Lactococcus nasutitermitis]